MEKIIYPVGEEFYNCSTKQLLDLTQHTRHFGVFSKYGTLLSIICPIAIVSTWKFLKLQKNEHNTSPLEKLKIPGPHRLVYHLTALFLPLVLLSTLMFAIFKQFVKFYLVFIHGEKFGGFFCSADSVWWVQEKNYNSIVPLLIVVKSNQKCNMIGKIRKRLSDRIFDTKEYPKLTSTCHFCCGYPYMISNQYSLDECVRALKIPNERKLDETYLGELISEIGTAEFAKKEAVWEVFVTNRHLDLNQKDYSYPLLIKFNHAVADGVGMVTFFIKVFGDSITEQYAEKVVGKYLEQANACKMRQDFKTKAVNLKRFIFHAFSLLYITLGRIFWALFLRQKDQSVLHGPTLSGTKIAVLAWENQQELVALVKNIKNKVPRCTFSDVLYTALSASLTDFFKSNNHPIPEKISTITPILLSYREVSNPGPVKLFNKFTVSVLDLPTAAVEGSLGQTLERVIEQNVIMKNLPEVEINYWLLNYIVGVIPLPILKRTLNLGGLTQVVSNVPGASKTMILDGCEITHVAAFPPHRWKTGLGMLIITYDNKLQIGLIVDKVLISSRDEAQKIVDNFFKNIRKINEEISLLYGK